MKALFITALTALAAVFQVHAASKGATEDWVRSYVSTNAAESSAGTIYESITNGWVTIRGYGTDGTNDWVEIRFEYPDKLALVASNVTAAALSSGVTNGMVFAWNGNGEFWNAPAGLFVSCVSNECFSFEGVKSSVTNGVDRFAGLFDVVGTKITWSMSASLLPAESASCGFSILDLIFPSARAEQWEDIEWYSPNNKGDAPANYSWAVKDSKGNVAELEYESDSDGNRYCSNISVVVESLKSSVNSVFENMVGLSTSLANACDDIYRIDAQMKEMADNLNKTFTDAWARMDRIEEALESPTDDGGSTPTVVEKTIIKKEREKIIIRGGVAPLKVDGVTIGVKDENTADAAYQLKNFPGASGVNVGLIPAIGNLSGRVGQLMWFDPWRYLDGDTIKIDRSDAYRHLPSNEDGHHGIHFAGWYSPEASPNRCSETIAANLTNAVEDTSHYVLTRYGNGSDSSVHYMRIGHLGKIAGGGAALRVVGTEGDVTVGSGATTNVISFASSSGAHVRVTPGQDGQVNATITVGWEWED